MRLPSAVLSTARALAFSQLDLGLSSTSGAFSTGVQFHVIAGEIGKSTSLLMRETDAAARASPETFLFSERVAGVASEVRARAPRSNTVRSRGGGGPGRAHLKAPSVSGALLPIAEEGGGKVSVGPAPPVPADRRRLSSKKRSQRSLLASARLLSAGPVDSMRLVNGGRYDSQVLRARVPGDFGPSPIAFGIQLAVDKVASSVHNLATKRAMRSHSSLQCEAGMVLASTDWMKRMRTTVAGISSRQCSPEVLVCTIGASSLLTMQHRQAVAFQLQAGGIHAEYMHPHFADVSDAILYATRAGIHVIVTTSLDHGRIRMVDGEHKSPALSGSPKRSPMMPGDLGSAATT